MTTKVYQVGLFAIISLSVVACGDDGPCLEGGDDGACVAEETGDTGDTNHDPKNPECAPFKDAKSATELTCQGDGTGWLVTDIYGAASANPITTCLSYETQDIPAKPTSDDCAAIPFGLIPYEIPAPTACCTDDAKPQAIVNTCMNKARSRPAASRSPAPASTPSSPPTRSSIKTCRRTSR